MVSTLKENAQNSVVAVFAQHSGAENAVKELKDSRFDVKKLSIVGSDYHSNEDVVGFYNIGDRMKYGEKRAHSGAGCGACYLERRSWSSLVSVRSLLQALSWPG